MNRSVAFASSLLLAIALAACGGNATKPDAVPAAAPTNQAAPAAPAAEGQRVEGVKLTPGVIEIAKTEGKVELAKDDRVRCEKFKPIGSNRTQKRCYTLAEKKKTEEDNAEAMRKMTTPPPSASSTIGR